MSIGIPGTANDLSILPGVAAPVPPPVNTANGDVLVAVVICRNTGGITPPAGWTTLVSTFGGPNGDGIVQYLPVPSAAGLPSNWTWGVSSNRADAIIFRVTGMNVSSPVFQVGATVVGGNDGGSALPLVLPGITPGGGAVSVVFTFWTDNVAPSDFVPGFSLLATSLTLTGSQGRSSLGTWSALTSSATGSITTANDWTAADGQDGVILGFQAAASAVTSGPPYSTRFTQQVADISFRSR